MADQWSCEKIRPDKMFKFIGSDGCEIEQLVPQLYCEGECQECQLKAQLFDA